jgi:energy-coupling factor transporter transmembrane protein EcfT
MVEVCVLKGLFVLSLVLLVVAIIVFLNDVRHKKYKAIAGVLFVGIAMTFLILFAKEKRDSVVAFVNQYNTTGISQEVPVDDTGDVNNGTMNDAVENTEVY